MSRHVVRSALSLILLLGCRSSDLVDPATTLSAQILHNDTTLLRGEIAAIPSRATYLFGEGLPITVVWGASDSTVITLARALNGEVLVTARANGSSLLVARINETFLDTITISVADTGAVRWRRTLVTGGVQGWDLAVEQMDGDIATTDGNGAVVMFTNAGDTAWIGTQPCFNLTGPAVTSSGIFVTGTQCARRFSIEGSFVWGDTIGGPDERSAVAPNGDLVVLSRPALPDTVLAVSRYDINGGLAWRDTLYTGADAVQPRGGVAVATNGDIYVAWHVGPGFLTRYSATGTERWTVTLPGVPYETAPAVLGDRVFVVHLRGVSVRDSTGAVIYDVAWAAVGGAAEAMVSPPVVDGAGNLYAQGPFGLFSLSGTGAVRWVADSIRRGSRYDSGPVVLLGTNALVTLCGLSACGVNAATGGVTWKGPALVATAPTQHGGLAVGPGGAIYVKIDNELIALWHRRGMASTGWPTLRGNMGRSGMAP
ncbi:MAG: hypothetical protein WD934_07505 [Gemmatimonadales bacterium]